VLQESILKLDSNTKKLKGKQPDDRYKELNSHNLKMLVDDKDRRIVCDLTHSFTRNNSKNFSNLDLMRLKEKKMTKTDKKNKK